MSLVSGCSLSCRQTSKPSRSGKSMSSRTRSGLSAMARSTPRVPLVSLVTSSPSGRRRASMSLWIGSLSSTTSTRLGFGTSGVNSVRDADRAQDHAQLAAPLLDHIAGVTLLERPLELSRHVGHRLEAVASARTLQLVRHRLKTGVIARCQHLLEL